VKPSCPLKKKRKVKKAKKARLSETCQNCLFLQLYNFCAEKQHFIDPNAKACERYRERHHYKITATQTQNHPNT
jgi:hypothetical protein